jgi:hypothetical protein
MRNLAGAYILLGAYGTLPQEAVTQALPGDAVPVFYETDYLLQANAADYWTLSEHYYPQATNCGCSTASVTMAVNALRSRVAPQSPALSEAAVVAGVDNAVWAARTAENGGGVTLADLELVLHSSLARFDLGGSVETIAASSSEPLTIEELRDALARNESTPNSVMLAYYNQATVTGDPTGGLHVSPIGAYNAEEDRVLLMDVDRECWVPYWTSTETLWSALATSDPREAGPLANATGGCLIVSAAA